MQRIFVYLSKAFDLDDHYPITKVYNIAAEDPVILTRIDSSLTDDFFTSGHKPLQL